jgi:peptidoglycan/LPS O-acetylase OafA/YrhL
MGSRARRFARAAVVAAALMAAAAPAASAADLWTEAGRSLTSVNYWQGITFDPTARAFTFDGPAEGLWRTNATLARSAGRSQGSHPRSRARTAGTTSAT